MQTFFGKIVILFAYVNYIFVIFWVLCPIFTKATLFLREPYGKNSRTARLSARPERGIPFRDGGAGRDKRAAIKAWIDAFLLKHDIQQKFG